MATATIGTGGTFSMAQAWEDSLSATLTSPEVGQYKNETFTGGVTFSGITTSPTNTITLECESGASFRDHAGKATNALRVNASNGAAILHTTGYTFGAITVGVPHVTVRNIQFRTSASNSWPFTINATNFTLDSCIVMTNGNVALTCGNGLAAGIVIKNCLVICEGTTVYALEMLTSNFTLSDCTVVRPSNLSDGSSIAIRNYYSTGVVKGCAFFNFATAGGGTSSTWTGSDKNSTNLASIGIGVGTHQTSLTYADQFENVGPTSGYLTAMDYRLKTGANLIDNGTTVSGITADIIGTARPQGSTEDVGCWEYAVAAPSWLYFRDVES